MDKPSKSWCFTINNPTEKDEQILADLEKSYLVYGNEVGDQGTTHLQGYICFTRAYRLSQLKKLNSRAHWEIAVCNDAMNYCMKDGNYKITDNRKKKGERTDLKEICQKPLAQIINENPDYYVRYHNGFDKLQYKLVKPRTEKPFVTWLWGPTGTGKTRHVTKKYTYDKVWISGRNLEWFDGYIGQEVALFDDFRGDFCTFHYLLRLLDWNPIKVPYKGGFVEFSPKRIYITSCFPPHGVYATREDVQQLIRRIDDIKNVTVTEVA